MRRVVAHRTIKRCIQRPVMLFARKCSPMEGRAELVFLLLFHFLFPPSLLCLLAAAPHRSRVRQHNEAMDRCERGDSTGCNDGMDKYTTDFFLFFFSSLARRRIYVYFAQHALPLTPIALMACKFLGPQFLFIFVF